MKMLLVVYLNFRNLRKARHLWLLACVAYFSISFSSRIPWMIGWELINRQKAESGKTVEKTIHGLQYTFWLCQFFLRFLLCLPFLIPIYTWTQCSDAHQFSWLFLQLTDLSDIDSASIWGLTVRLSGSLVFTNRQHYWTMLICVFVDYYCWLLHTINGGYR